MNPLPYSWARAQRALLSVKPEGNLLTVSPRTPAWAIAEVQRRHGALVQEVCASCVLTGFVVDHALQLGALAGELDEGRDECLEPVQVVVDADDRVQRRCAERVVLRHEGVDDDGLPERFLGGESPGEHRRADPEPPVELAHGDAVETAFGEEAEGRFEDLVVGQRPRSAAGSARRGRLVHGTIITTIVVR